MSAGEIQALSLNISAINAEEDAWLRIRYKESEATELNTFEDGFTEVYSYSTSELSAGWQMLLLEESIIWDGVSSVVLEFIVERFQLLIVRSL